MTYQASANYRDGVIYLQHPLELPDNCAIDVVITPTDKRRSIVLPPRRQITPEQLQDLIEKYGVSVGSLPVDFSRADIYNDHD